MSNQQINYSAIRTEKAKLMAVRDDLDEVFKYIESNTNQLRDYWETKTSREVFQSFESFCEYIKTIKENFDRDIDFLEKEALPTYEIADATTIKQEDEHLQTA